MPITLEESVRKLSQDQFGEIAYELMGSAFELHNAMGRFFDEHVYRNEVLRQFGERGKSEVFIHADHGDFRKTYRVDLLIDGGAVFEFKTVRQLLEIHRSQLIHYLMLLELHHGKLVNFRPDQVEHEFVNCSVTMNQRKTFEIEPAQIRGNCEISRCFQQVVLDLLNDWGTGLEAPLYDDAIMHRFGGTALVAQDIDIVRAGHRIGTHPSRLLNPETAYKVTSLSRDLPGYESNLKRFVAHTGLDSVLWANITLGHVSFHEITK